MTFPCPAVRLRKFWFVALGSILVFGSLTYAWVKAQNQMLVRERVSDVQLVTEDIPRFWKAFDQAQTASDPATVFEREYLEPGTVGLKDLTAYAPLDGEALAEAVRSKPKYFKAIRTNTLNLAKDDQVLSSIKTHFENLQKLYPPAKFQDVYFLIGVLNTGGTSSARGLLLGTEMNARDPNTPIEELSPWLQDNTGSLQDLPFLVTHEEIHALQAFAGNGDDTGKNLLWKSLQEGGADFLASLATHEKPHGAYFKYGLEHERDLWREFSMVMDRSDLSSWLYNGDKSKSHPADLGYFIGYRILEAYYNQMPDKQKAIAELLAIRDPEAILKDSGYNP
jgi:Predicted Zn-dependent protease (DUF2268)